MVKRTGGARRKTRRKYRKKYREKGKISIRDYLQEFNKGDNVYIRVEPSVHKGMPFRRFIGKIGIVEGKRGECYEVKIKDGRTEKLLIIHPVHLKPVKR